MKFDFSILWEAIKEPLRLLVLAIIPVVLIYFQELPYQWAALIVLVLRFIDSYLHQANKALPVKSQNDGLLGEKGLTGF